MTFLLIISFVALTLLLRHDNKWTFASIIFTMICLFSVLNRIVPPSSPHWIIWCHGKIIIGCWITLFLGLIFFFKQDNSVATFIWLISACIAVLTLVIALQFSGCISVIGSETSEPKQVTVKSNVKKAAVDKRIEGVSKSSLDALSEKYNQYQKEVKLCLDAPRVDSTHRIVKQIVQQGQEIQKSMQETIASLNTAIKQANDKQVKLNEQKTKIASMQVRDRTQTIIEQLKVESEDFAKQKGKIEAFLLEVEQAGRDLAEYSNVLEATK